MKTISEKMYQYTIITNYNVCVCDDLHASLLFAIHSILLDLRANAFVNCLFLRAKNVWANVDNNINEDKSYCIL